MYFRKNIHTWQGLNLTYENIQDVIYHKYLEICMSPFIFSMFNMQLSKILSTSNWIKGIFLCHIHTSWNCSRQLDSSPPLNLLFTLKYLCRQKSLCSRNDFYKSFISFKESLNQAFKMLFVKFTYYIYQKIAPRKRNTIMSTLEYQLNRKIEMSHFKIYASVTSKSLKYVSSKQIWSNIMIEHHHTALSEFNRILLHQFLKRNPWFCLLVTMFP